MRTVSGKALPRNKSQEALEEERIKMGHSLK